MISNKIIFFLVFLFILTNAHAIIVFSDDFASGTLTGYDTNSGTWSAATNRLVGAALDGGAISHTISMPVGADYNISFKNDPVTNALVAGFSFFTDQNGIGNLNGYQIMLQGNNNARLRRITNGSPTNLISGGTMNIGIMHDVNLNVDSNGFMVLFVDGNTIGSVITSTYTTGTRFVISSENGASSAIWDDIVITTDGVYAPIVSVTYSNFGTQASTGKKFTNTLNYLVNYNCSGGTTGILKRYINLTNDLNETATCDGTNRSISNTYQHPLSGTNFNIDFNLFDSTFLNQSTVADANFYSDLNVPTMDINFSSSSSGFGASVGTVTAYLTCRDIISPRINYDLNNSAGTNLINNQFDANTTQAGVSSVGAGNTIFVGSCVDLAGNRSTDTNSVDVVSTCFNLVNEQTGADWTGIDINNVFSSLKAVAYSNGNSYNFKSNLDNDICFTSIEDDTIRFDINYNSGLFLYREFRLSLVSDLNISTAELNVCLATSQDFFEQAIISARETPVVVQNKISECYNLIDYTKYSRADALSLSAFTVSSPYNIKTFVDSVLTLLPFINGGAENEINLDVLIFRTRETSIPLYPEELSVSIYNTSETNLDSNILKIYYINDANSNVSSKVDVYNDNTIIFTQTITNSPNNFSILLNMTDLNFSGSSQKVILTKILSNGSTETLTRYFSFRGNEAIFPPAFIAILAFMFFIFAITLIGWRSAMGLYGLIITLLTLGITTLAPGVGWIILIQAGLLITAIFIFIIYKDDTVRSF